MDIVITYVNGNDPVWQSDYEKYTSVPAMQKRFRDWGTLRYLLRGVEKNMPYIRNVYLVVSHPSQVPEWADTENLKIVLHKDIIPEEFLPTFNSNTIEMHLHRIEGLDEEFLYFNDDCFPIGHSEPTDFFRDGKIVIGFNHHLLAPNMYKKICRNSDRLARRAAGKRGSCLFIRPQHICTPMLRSESAELYAKAQEEIRRTSACRVRNENNVTQYIFLNYLYFKGRVIPHRISKRHFSVSVASVDKLRDFLLNPTKSMVCINDVKLPDGRYQEMREVIHKAFETSLPDKSKYER